MEKLKKLLLIFFLILIALFIAIGTLENGILLTIISFVVIYLFVDKVKIKNFYIFLILFCLITKIISILILNNPILADYYIMLEASKKVLVHDFSFVNDYYFLSWGYQIFHVLYQALMLRIINNILFLKILNVIYSTVITVFIYKIIKNICNEKSARIVSLLYSISLYPLYLNGVLGNQQLGFMLMIIGLYIFLFKEHNIKNLIIIGLIIGVSNLERTEGIVYILTILIYLIITNKNIKSILKSSFIIILTYFIVNNGASFLMIHYNINDIGFKNTNPEWKFLIGFNYQYNGKNNKEDEIYLDDLNKEKDEIINRMTNFKKIPNLFYQKIKIQWLYSDLEDTFNVKNNTQFSNGLMNIILNYVKIINLTIIILVFYGLYKNKKFNKVYYFFIINLCIYFGIYLFIEVAARYYFNPQITVLILSSLGINKLSNYFDKKNKSFRHILK